MWRRWLKPLRVVVALACVAAISAAYLDVWDLGATSVAEPFIALQFAPSLVGCIGAAGIATAGFTLVLVLTLAFGRIYCSTLCPLGTLQDGISRVAGGWHPAYTFTPAHPRLRYAVLLLTVLTVAVGSGLLLNLLEPFSSTGRMLTALARPVVLAANNATASTFELAGWFGVHRLEWPALSPVAVGVAAVTFALITWLAGRHGRLYCNTLCPVGTLLGLVARIAPYRPRIGATACTRCGRCERACKAGCIDVSGATIDASRCVACYNCVATCPHDAVRLSPVRPTRTNTQPAEPTRRNLLLGLLAGGASLCVPTAPIAPIAHAALPPGFVASGPTTIPERKAHPLSPPGSRSIAHFTARCTACHLCVAACPSRVLLPALFEYGPSGLLQPLVDAHASYCSYDCTICSQACPTGAILPLDVQAKHRTQIGVAHFIKDNCIVHTDLTNCGACSEHCPTKAVHMVDYPNTSGRTLVIPAVDASICVGCGACEYACPTRPFRAIYVDGNPEHKRAQKPVTEKLEHPDPTEDFPF